MIPSISIVTPSFNQVAYLEQTIRSVLDQEVPGLEYIIVDGGSTDGSVDIIRRYADRLAWWTSEPDAGQADAINKGASHASAPYLAWLNSDDLYYPGAINAAIRALEAHPEAVAVYSDLDSIDGSGRRINATRMKPCSLESLLCFQILGQPAVFMRREAFVAAGGLDTSYHLLLDHHLWIRLAQKGKMEYVPGTWSAARYHDAAKNRRQASGFGTEAFRIVQESSADPALAGVVHALGPRMRAAAHRVSARYLLDGGRPWDALNEWVNAFGLHAPTALRRPNLLFSALLDFAGLGRWRRHMQKHVGTRRAA